MSTGPQSDWEKVQHGTSYGAAQQCYRLNPLGGCCGPCRKVWSAYIAERRAKNPEVAEREKQMDYARSRALWRLARLHPGDYQQLVDEEAAKIGTRVRRRTDFGSRHRRSEG